MASIELKELRFQLEELSQKRFINPSKCAIIGCLVLYVKKEEWNLAVMYYFHRAEHDHHQKTNTHRPK